ncbi:MAG: acyl-CoA dehydrogenase [Bacteroidetes bacterium]|nr:MAG: acyl-CoA dehydrogenase [Bacteroidota bacterium]
MDAYYFTEEHNLFRESLRAFLDREVMPNIDSWEEAQRIPPEVWQKMGAQGFLGLGYPAAYGGSELDFFFDVVFVEEISKCFSGGFAINQMVVQYMSAPYLLKHGSESLKAKYLPGIVSGELISAIGISEPGAGSDVANIQTTARREGDVYVVDGAKTFITNAVYGDLIVTVVKTDPAAGIGGISLLVIDRQAEGVSATKLRKLGWHASDTAELSFDGVRVPAENLVGEEGQGFYYLMGGLQLERLVGAIGAYAGCESALAYTLEYMGQRKAFGRPISKFQVLRHRIAQLAAEVESVKQFVRHCARMHNDGHYAVKESSMAKLLATELADKVMYQCLQCFGGYGYMEEYKIARMFRDSRIGTIGGGTSEIMREIIAKMVIDDQQYQSAGTAPAAPATDLDALLPRLTEKVAAAPRLGSRLKLALGTRSLLIDGTGDANALQAQDGPADCTLSLAEGDFVDLLRGKLDPMAALMGGKLTIDGDMAVAMKVQSLFGG